MSVVLAAAKIHESGRRVKGRQSRSRSDATAGSALEASAANRTIKGEETNNSSTAGICRTDLAIATPERRSRARLSAARGSAAGGGAQRCRLCCTRGDGPGAQQQHPLRQADQR